MRCAALLLLLFAGLAALALGASSAVAQGAFVKPSELRVCLDPSNLPFSSEKEDGFENKIAQLLGQALDLKVRNIWFPRVMGFMRNTLGSHRCDLVMGTVAGDDLLETTVPYYHTTYFMVFRADRNLALSGFDDPKLRDMTIGLVAGTPPADLLVRHDLMDRAKSYAFMVDTRHESPTRQMVQDIVDGKVDVGLLWGPIAGYYAKHDKLPLTLVPIQKEAGGPPMDYEIAMGVRRGEPEWLHLINDTIKAQRDAIVAVLKEYGVPLLDEHGKPIE